MNTEPTIHVMPVDGFWTVMTADKSFVKEGFNSRTEAIRCAGQIAAEGKFTFLMIHSNHPAKMPKQPANQLKQTAAQAKQPAQKQQQTA